MKVSIAITTHNEGVYVASLLGKLTHFIKSVKDKTPHDYELVIVDDFSDDLQTIDMLDEVLSLDGEVKLAYHKVDKDFATHKNFVNDLCTGDWILALDADEYVSNDFLFNIPAFAESNPEIEAFWIPRVNTVEGLTLDHVRKWRWVLSTLPEYTQAKMIDPASEEYRLLKEYNYIIKEDNGFVIYNQPIIMWPDLQMRLYKNDPKIKWEGKVHERLVGFENYSAFPSDPSFAIQHHKQIARQEKQNELYETITR